MRTRLIIAALAAGAALTLTACSSSTHDKPAPVDTKLSGEILKSAGPSAGIPPAPTGAQRADYLAAVRAIDPALADTQMYSDDSLIRGGRDACQAIKFKVATTTQIATVRVRLTSTGWAATDDQAQQFITASRQDICPTY
jgi:hypothetical protein